MDDGLCCMRLSLGIEYDGTDFYGWQKQKSGLRTIQATVEEAISKVANEPIEVICAGRTDTGVHAYGQVIHFDTNAIRNNDAWLLGTNTNLPKDVSIKWVKSSSSTLLGSLIQGIVRSYTTLALTGELSGFLIRSSWTSFFPSSLSEYSDVPVNTFLLNPI